MNREWAPIQLDFLVKGYPGTGRRVESEPGLASVSSVDLTNGAFMGDAVVVVGRADLSTRFGWVTLIDWMIRLSVGVRQIQHNPVEDVGFMESDDRLWLERIGDDVRLSCTYSPAVAVVSHAELSRAVNGFVDAKLRWIFADFHEAFQNPAMERVLELLGRPRNT